jgi:peptidyl-prolyl cis-trans isomerase C
MRRHLLAVAALAAPTLLVLAGPVAAQTAAGQLPPGHPAVPAGHPPAGQPAGGPAVAPGQPATPGAGAVRNEPPAASDIAPGAALPNPVVARVGDKEIHQSDLAAAAQGLPEQYRNLPPQVLYPMLLDQVIDREALVIAARKQGLENDPRVQEQMHFADDRVLQNALLSREVGPTLTDAAVRARYDQQYAGKQGAEEVHAEHILLPSKEKAEQVLAELKNGADFTALAKKYSTDPSAANGGDLGWFKKGDMVPAFADAAFSLKPGEVDPQPVQTQFGWHVIKVLDKRQSPPPPFEQVQNEIRQSLIRDGVAKAVADAKQGLQVVRYNPDGSEVRPGATPGAPAVTAPGAAPSTPPAPAPAH